MISGVTEKDHKQVFETWLQQHKGLVFKVVRAYASGAMEEDDLFQEITIQIWKSIPAFRNHSAVTTWIYRISLNTAIKWIRQSHRHSTESLDNVHQLLQATHHVPDERLNWLYEQIRNLDEIDRSVTLLMLDSYSYKEISNILGISESNVGVKINRIKKQLIEKSKNINYGI